LETAKEEMQSLNEELNTVNSELQNKVESLSETNDDMQNLLNSTDIATIFLDCNLKIKRFTRQAKNIIKLIDSDIGRPLEDLVSTLKYDT
jgi:two-component system CheB/CheR fusion protein